MASSKRFLPNLALAYYTFVTFINYGETVSACKNIQYTTIRDERRSTSKKTPKEGLLCDRNVIQRSIWYRFEISNGNQLATTRPNYNHCGTYAPIWMNGIHPSVAEGKVSRKACASVPYTGDCAYSYVITVLNCSGFYIYQLEPPSHCYLAYCIASNQTSNATSTTLPSIKPTHDTKDCVQNPKVCHVQANCSDSNGSFSCHCRSGFEGDGRLNCTVSFPYKTDCHVSRESLDVKID